MDKIQFNRDRKFDLQLSASLIHERRLAAVFAGAKLEKIELKSETWQWEQTGNICIEYRCDGRPSGISTTESDCWVHELRRGDGTLAWIMFPIERLKELARDAIRRGRCRHDWRWRAL
jgi:hypothetical protein